MPPDAGSQHFVHGQDKNNSSPPANEGTNEPWPGEMTPSVICHYNTSYQSLYL